MKKWIAAIAMGGLIVSFQNCSKSNLGANGSADASSQENPATAAPVSSLEPSKAVAIEIPNSPYLDQKVEVASKAGATSFNSYSLLINPQTGVINVLLGNGDIDSSKEYCLNSQQIAQLEDLLAHSRLYEAYTKDQGQEEICTQEYEFPYAKLHFQDQSVSLGEKVSGCHYGSDLGKSSALQLKQFLSSMIENLPNSQCSFQDVQ